MSKASKITLALSAVFSVATISGVYYMAETEKEALQDGPIKDRERLERRFNKKQQENLNDFERQKALYAEFTKDQPLTGEITEGIDVSK
ncbi:Pet117 protein [Martiniozyma asiatica (nom. inval.)]|nr:Pet117 protein [Martiniozyma asiatica]